MHGKIIRTFFLFPQEEIAMGKKVMVFVGTQKGGFIFSSDAKRKRWKTNDIQFKSWNVMHIQMDPRDQRLHAATSHFVYGPTTHYSDDLARPGPRRNRYRSSPVRQNPDVPPALWRKPSARRAAKASKKT